MQRTARAIKKCSFRGDLYLNFSMHPCAPEDSTRCRSSEQVGEFWCGQVGVARGVPAVHAIYQSPRVACGVPTVHARTNWAREWRVVCPPCMQKPTACMNQLSARVGCGVPAVHAKRQLHAWTNWAREWRVVCPPCMQEQNERESGVCIARRAY